jgi:hypothetical protein
MNDDRRFRERAEMMKELFLAQIKTEVISKVAGISISTVVNDRSRVEKLYGIKLPKPAIFSPNIKKRFNTLFAIYVKVQSSVYRLFDWENLYKAAELSIDVKRIENFIHGMESLWNIMQFPQISTVVENAKNYEALINNCWHPKERGLLYEFYDYLAKNEELLKSLDSVDMVIDAAKEFVASQNRETLTNLMIPNVNVLKPWLHELTDSQFSVIDDIYGLTSGVGISIQEIADKHELTRERIRQIRDKSIRILSNGLSSSYSYLVSSHAKVNYLELKLQTSEENYSSLCKTSDKKIYDLTSENQVLAQKIKGIDAMIDAENYNSVKIKCLAMKLRDSTLDVNIVRKLYDYDYVVDLIERWDKICQIRSVGQTTILKIEIFLKVHGIKKEDITDEEIGIARRIIKKKESE